MATPGVAADVRSIMAAKPHSCAFSSRSENSPNLKFNASRATQQGTLPAAERVKVRDATPKRARGDFRAGQVQKYRAGLSAGTGNETDKN